MADEVFGPILPILTYNSLNKAFERIAATPRPLAGFVFSRNQKTIDRFVGELSYGGGGVNLVNVHLFVETMPFGGTGLAGMRHYYGKYGFEVVGADAAEKFLLGKGVAAERSAVVWEAIALHTSNGIALRRAPEVALVHIGASIDVMGLGLEKLPPTMVAQTIEALPRDNF